MIDFAKTIRKNRVLDRLDNDEFKKVDLVFSSNNGNANPDFPDLARRIVSTSPATSVALAFAAGGIFGWLTMRR